MSRFNNLKFGADPEVFVKRGGVFVSAHELVPGTKKKPHKVKLGAVQIDGTALEFNIDPASTEEEFVRNIQTVLATLGGMARMSDPGIELAVEPVADFDPDHFYNLPPSALELGCEPDFNAYTEMPNPRPFTVEPMRTASGHIHCGWDVNPDPEQHRQDCIDVVKQLDKSLLEMSYEWDKDERRRSLYGAPGAFRIKPYGVEYRVLSNVWIKDEATIRTVFNVTKKAMEDLSNGIVY